MIVCYVAIRADAVAWFTQVSDAVVSAIEQLEPWMESIYQAQTAAGQTRWNEHLAVDLRLAGKGLGHRMVAQE